MPGSVPRWFTQPKTVTHSGTNHAQCRVATLVEISTLPLSRAFVLTATMLIRVQHIMLPTATQTHCYNPVAPAYPIWAYYAHGRQCRCQEDPASLPFDRLEKTTRSSPHHVAQHRQTGSETTPPYAPRSSRFGSEPPSVEDDVDVWRFAILSCMPETTTTMYLQYVAALRCES